MKESERGETERERNIKKEIERERAKYEPSNRYGTSLILMFIYT